MAHLTAWAALWTVPAVILTVYRVRTLVARHDTLRTAGWL